MNVIDKVKKSWSIIDNYGLSRFLGKPSTALFWYYPEPPNITNVETLNRYKQLTSKAPFYLMNYAAKLQYSLANRAGIIVLPYESPIGKQVNPEAAFQYALGLHDQYLVSGDSAWLEKFWCYVDYFLQRQGPEGDWYYDFTWRTLEAPWASALAQARGASVMLRAWLHSGNRSYLQSALLAVSKFDKATDTGGFLHLFMPEKCYYFEEYPGLGSGVINGFMACLFGLWELKIWTGNEKVSALWEMGVESLQKMLPYYTLRGWTLYDKTGSSKTPNINSPRYHRLMTNYMLVLSVLHDAPIFKEYYAYWDSKNTRFSQLQALMLKFKNKICSS
jgi:hypothetical protein